MGGPWISVSENKHFGHVPSMSRKKPVARKMLKRKTSCVPLQRSTARWQTNSKNVRESGTICIDLRGVERFGRRFLSLVSGGLPGGEQQVRLSLVAAMLFLHQEGEPRPDLWRAS